MQCKDCLKEIDDSEYYNRSLEGVCKKCRARMSQIKYENKKFGTDKKYVPLRLKEKAPRKRKTTNIENVEKVVENNDEEERIYSKEIEEAVLKDIEETFKEKNVKINPQEIPPFRNFYGYVL